MLYRRVRQGIRVALAAAVSTLGFGSSALAAPPEVGSPPHPGSVVNPGPLAPIGTYALTCGGQKLGTFSEVGETTSNDGANTALKLTSPTNKLDAGKWERQALKLGGIAHKAQTFSLKSQSAYDASFAAWKDAYVRDAMHPAEASCTIVGSDAAGNPVVRYSLRSVRPVTDGSGAGIGGLRISAESSTRDWIKTNAPASLKIDNSAMKY